MTFVQLIVAVHRALDRAGVSHAFGGALALGFVAEPRGTADIDVNVFVPVEGLAPVVEAIGTLGYRLPDPSPTEVPIAGLRAHHPTEPFPLDVFPSLHERYALVEDRRVRHRFGPHGDLLPFLSAEDLCVFKLSFGRPRDWVDLAAIAEGGHPIDVEYVEEQLVALRGPTMYPEVARLRALLRNRA